MTNAQHQSATAEHGTPSDILDRVRRVLGGIDLDPASSRVFNRVVKAENYYNERTNGFVRPWGGKVYLNPPGGSCDARGRRVVLLKDTGFVYLSGKRAPGRPQSAMASWWYKLAQEWVENRVRAAIFMGFSLEVLQRTQSFKEAETLPVPLDFPCCYPRARLRYSALEGKTLKPGNAPTHASVIVLLPPKQAGAARSMKRRFEREFSLVGRVKL